MPIKYLEVSAEEAVKRLTKLIEEGYKIKIGMDSEYTTLKQEKGGIDNSSVIESIEKWEVVANKWFSEAIAELFKIYTSKRMGYEFREAHPTIGLISKGNSMKWSTFSRNLGTKIDKLNQFDDFIKREFRIEIEYIAGDKFDNYGTGNQTKSTTK